MKNNLKNDIQNICSQMPNANLSQRGNMAIVEVNIPGIRSRFAAHSKINNALDKGVNITEFSYVNSDSEKKFTMYVIDQYPRYHDTEVDL